MPKKIRPKPEPKEPPAMGLIICHIDGLILYIENTDRNCDRFAENFSSFLEEISLRFTGHPQYKGPQFIGNPQFRKSVYTFQEGTTQLKILFHAWLTPFIKRKRRLPNSLEIKEMRFQGRFLAKVEIINTQKARYRKHMENIYTAVEILEQLDISICKIEIALDTEDKNAGDFIRKYTCLKKGPAYDQVFHSKGSAENKPKIDGPSPNGNDEYFGDPTRGRKPQPGRPVGGRKQIFSYIKEIDENNTTIQRVELRLYREVAGKLRARYGPLVSDVIRRLEDILRACIWFQKLDLVKMHSKKPLINILSPKDLSTKGQRYELLKAGYGNTFIKRYVETFLWPEISFPPYR